MPSDTGSFPLKLYFYKGIFRLPDGMSLLFFRPDEVDCMVSKMLAASIFVLSGLHFIWCTSWAFRYTTERISHLESRDSLAQKLSSLVLSQENTSQALHFKISFLKWTFDDIVCCSKSLVLLSYKSLLHHNENHWRTCTKLLFSHSDFTNIFATILISIKNAPDIFCRWLSTSVPQVYVPVCLDNHSYGWHFSDCLTNDVYTFSGPHLQEQTGIVR